MKTPIQDDTYGLTPSTLEMIRTVFASFPAIKEAVIYGPRAEGIFKKGSDVDLALKGQISYQNLWKIEKKLEEALLPHKFNLSVYHNITKKDLVDQIEKHGQRIYVQQ